jgi:hypothetical protein
MDIDLITHPRSAKHWFRWYIQNNTDLTIDTLPYIKKDSGTMEIDNSFNARFNNLTNLGNTMAIIRNPKDCLASLLTMESLDNLELRLKQYIYYYEFIMDNVEHIFRFEDVISDPAKIAEYFCKRSNKTFSPVKTDYAQYEQWYLQSQDPRKLITSKTNSLYDQSRSMIDNVDLSKHNDLYEKALAKCLIL